MREVLVVQAKMALSWSDGPRDAGVDSSERSGAIAGAAVLPPRPAGRPTIGRG